MSKKVIAISGLLLCVFSTLSYAGGSSTAGPGAPQLLYTCQDQLNSLSVVLYRQPTDNYQGVYLGINDQSNGQSEGVYEGLATENSAVDPGASVVYVSDSYQLTINTGYAPQFNQNGTAVFSATLKNLAIEPYPVQPIALACQLLN